ncbi:ACT domain-containing protein ACR9 [Senna tora]|uniref:ACT domain-containing protein ACR9 n=1 Tax=Senna tora TaxID=362788 RepID=A0A834SKQ4_9FABA|nr:ACT domain-containing protein ACR9 [Senna tora]
MIRGISSHLQTSTHSCVRIEVGAPQLAQETEKRYPDSVHTQDQPTEVHSKHMIPAEQHPIFHMSHPVAFLYARVP